MLQVSLKTFDVAPSSLIPFLFFGTCKHGKLAKSRKLPKISEGGRVRGGSRYVEGCYGFFNFQIFNLEVFKLDIFNLESLNFETFNLVICNPVFF